MWHEIGLLDSIDQPGCRRSLMALGIGVLGSTDFQYSSGGKAAWLATSASCKIQSQYTQRKKRTKKAIEVVLGV